MTITEFLEARIAEDEAAAGKLAGVAHSAKTQVYTGEEWVTTPISTERVLVECAAKRAIIELARKAVEAEKEWDDHEWQGTVESTEPLTGDTILYALAAVYASHPDYRREWAL